MAFTITLATAATALPTFAHLYGADGPEFAEVIAQLEPIWLATGERGAVGAIGLRPATVHGSELMGGVAEGEGQIEAVTALLKTAKEHAPRLYAYAEAHFFPAAALEGAGFVPVSAYTKLTGPLPTQPPEVPAGYTLKPLAEVNSLDERLTAQESYADLIGHTPTTEGAVQPGAGGSDESLGWLGYDASGRPVGVIRVWRDGDEISMGTPGIHPKDRASGLRQALILTACQSARQAGVQTLVLESWGDTEHQRQEDLSLGLTLEVSTPIYQTSAR